MSGHIELTRFAKSGGPLCKRISLGPDGQMISDGSACIMTRGRARRVTLNNLSDLAALIADLDTHEALGLGALNPSLPDVVEVTTKRKLNGHDGPALIARTSDHIFYRPGQPALCLIDFDTKGMPAAVRTRIAELGGLWPALETVLPELASAGYLARSSTSSNIFRADTNVKMRASDGQHIYLPMLCGDDIERFLGVLHDRCWLHGLGWYMVGRAGQMLERSIIDRMVSAPERLVFEAPPEVVYPLQQAERRSLVVAGCAVDTRAICRDLSMVERSRLTALKCEEATCLKGPAAKARAGFIGEQAANIMDRTGCPLPDAVRVVEQQCGGILLPNVVLPFDDEEYHGATVADVLADPGRFIGATLSDPVEGCSYGTCKAMIMQRSDGTLWIHSYAHGRTVYDLKYDASAVEAELRKTDAKEMARSYVRLVMTAALDGEEQRMLRDLASELGGAKPAVLNSMLKDARNKHDQRRAEDIRDRQNTVRADARIRLPVPSPDAERLPVVTAIEDVFLAATGAEPPMRSLDGWPTEVRERPPALLHELTADGANEDEVPNTRLPPPAMPLLSPHDRYSLAHLIERHMAFVTKTKEGEVPAAVPPVFVDHCLNYRDSKLPLVSAAVTAPLVLPDGTLLMPDGLDRARKLVFRIEPDLRNLMPNPRDCTPASAAHALDFLVNDWLCDVSADFAGRCVLIAYALTIIERVLLPERPAFFITAGKRGGGKTTAVMMITLAVTGKKPAAAAWSFNEDERRKAMLAHPPEGLPALVWDNIPLGSSLSCSTLEAVLTSESYSDRVLGISKKITVSTQTVMAFTGNNIGPCGDLTSRSLRAPLDVDRPDPENRDFTHPDPVAWTLNNRGKILSALYTVLMANTRLHQARAERPLAKTRFKTWWHLVGSAIEQAAATLAAEHATNPPEQDRHIATTVDFRLCLPNSKTKIQKPRA
jgi:hypothetical protein